MLLFTELGLLLIALVIAVVFPELGARQFAEIERRFAMLARRRWLAVLTIGAAALFLRAALLPVLPIPEPVVHDDFCYLLAADTYAHGRLTNPTHPMWVHFESFGLIQQPSYQCIAQPAQGMILAAGKVAFGHPFWGVWLSVGLMCAAICWMLQGWVPARWALLGGLLAILRVGSFTYWANSYWGGAAGAIGGALVLGSLPRIKRSQRMPHVLALGCGLAVLANCRPYEGFVFSLPIAAALFTWMLGRSGPPLGISLRRIVLPLVVLVSSAGLAVGYYCWRVTGDPLRMPYQVEKETYGVAPYFLWQHLSPPPTFHHEAMRDMYVNRLPQMYEFSRSWLGVIAKAYRAWSFFLGPALTFPLLMLLVVLPYGFSWSDVHKRTRLLVFVCGLLLLGLAAETFFEPHYASPLAGAIFAFVVLAMRRLSRWRLRNRPSGLFLVRAIPLICVVMFLLRAAAGPLHLALAGSYAPAWHQLGPKSAGRPAILAQLQQSPGQHLVIVRYKADRIPFEEWVYNDADIDAAKVVWAREMDPSENDTLITYFAHRQVWLLEADETPPRLSPYSSKMRMGNFVPTSVRR